MNLYDDQYLNAEPERKPTLRQYVAANKGKSMPKRFLVTKVWTPGKYPSYTVETEHFRASVGKNTPIGDLLRSSWEELTRSETPTFLELDLSVNNKPSIRFRAGKGSGYWVDISSEPVLGIAWETL